MARRLWAICRKEWIQIRRDPRTLAVVWALPLVQLTLYGYAMNFDLKHIEMAWVDYDHSRASRRLRDAFEHSDLFRVRYHPERACEAERLVLSAQVRQAIVVPRGFEQALWRGEGAPLQILLDGADPITGSTALGYTQGLLAQAAEAEARARRMPPPVGVDIRTRVLYNPELRSTHFIVPGLIAVLLTMLAALLTSATVVRERERGTFEALIATPVRPMELMVGKLIPYVGLAFAQVFLVVLAGRVLFGVRMQGSLALLAALSLVFLLAALGVGLFISTVAHTQQVAMMGAIMATVIPSQLLSGFAFPIRNMPKVLQYLSNLFPATHYLVIVRSIYLKGVGIEALWSSTFILIGFALLLLGICARRFRKEL